MNWITHLIVGFMSGLFFSLPLAALVLRRAGCIGPKHCVHCRLRSLGRRGTVLKQKWREREEEQ